MTCLHLPSVVCDNCAPYRTTGVVVTCVNCVSKDIRIAELEAQLAEERDIVDAEIAGGMDAVVQPAPSGAQVMRRFIVYLDKNVVGVETDTEIIELPDDATDAQIEEVCADCLDTLIGNNLDTGWRELEEGE